MAYPLFTNPGPRSLSSGLYSLHFLYQQRDIPRLRFSPAPEFDKMEAIGTLKAFGFIKEPLVALTDKLYAKD